jgi:hypothetical protein
MLSKNEAIDILEDFFHHRYNIDPIYNKIIKAHVLTISEFEYCWVIHQCNENERNLKTREGYIGGGTYFIDKETGKIYAIGSGRNNWEENFINFKQGQPSSINWEEEINYYVNCQVINDFKFFFQEIKLSCKFDEKDDAIHKYFNANGYLSQSNYPPSIINKQFEYEYGELILLMNERQLSEQVQVIYLDFEGGFNNYSKMMWELKKFTRVHKVKEVGNNWISVFEKDYKKPFKEWSLRLNMEITKTI